MKVKDPFLPVALIIALVLVAGGYYYWTRYQRETAPPAAPAPQAETAPETEKAEPEKRYPIESIAPPASPEEAAPLPPLRESDATLRDAAAKLIGAETLERYFNRTNIARRFVVTVEELPRRKVGSRYNLLKPVAGNLVADGKEADFTLSAANYERYTSYVVLAEAVPTDKLVALYVRFYPLFQEEYKTLGYPKRYFNDRVVETIDDLLAAPEIQGPIRLTRPKVMYEFADPELEKLSAGQKIMIRMGPENAAKIKAKLREIRAAITTAVR